MGHWGQAMNLWLQLGICTALILYSGTKLCVLGDVIAEKTGMGRTWIGFALLASVTSLPELATGVSAVAVVDAPDIAVGDVLGSCMFNLLILAVIDGVAGPVPLSARAHQGQVLVAAFGVLMLGLVATSFVIGDLSLGWFSPFSLVFLAVYFVAMRSVFLYEKRRIASVVREVAEQESISLRRALVAYALNALVVVLAAMVLPHAGEGIAASTGLGGTLVGSALIALSTSLPEVVVSVAALRMGAIDLFMGNLFGSNLFNIAILGIDDLVYTKGPLLTHAAPTHQVSALAASSMTAVAMIGLTFRASSKKLFLGWDSVGIVALYVSALVILYQRR